MPRSAAPLLLVFVAACGARGSSDEPPPSPQDASVDASVADAAGPEDGAARDDARVDGGESDAGESDAGGPPDDPCLGVPTCDGIPVESFPFVDTGDTTMEGSDAFDAYSCAARTDESGPEVIYVVDVEEPGLLGVRVEDGDGVDIDVHVLDMANPDACLARNDQATSALVGPGRHYVVADTFVDGGGAPQAGEYTITIRFLPVPEVDCATMAVAVPMFWSSCPADMDCVEMDDGTGTIRPHLHTPTTGPVVKEAHLVTAGDGFEGWPTSASEHLDAHYRMSEAATDYVQRRREPWAPAGEGGSMWGQGAIGSRLPVVDEGYYVNMYWRRRPSAGTRMLIRNPENGRTLVAAAGYETGPGDSSRIGGVVEEVHDYLGTAHLDALELSFLVDATLPFGPVRCR